MPQLGIEPLPFACDTEPVVIEVTTMPMHIGFSPNTLDPNSIFFFFLPFFHSIFFLPSFSPFFLLLC